MAQLQTLLLYALDVPARLQGALGNDVPRYVCCQHTARQGHAKTCTPSTRAEYVEKTLNGAGIGFARVSDEAEGRRWLERTSVIAASSPEEGDREWLAELLNHAPYIDPHDDEESLVDLILPYARIIRICVEERDRRAREDTQSGNEEARKLPQFPGAATDYRSDCVRDEQVDDSDPVNHPSHYCSHPSGIECIDVTEHMSANIAAAMKYLWRAGLKPNAAHDEDLAKAVWYVQRERERVGKSPRNTEARGGEAR